MHRLGYTRYVAQGGDVGALVTDLMGRQAVEGLVGYHLNLLTAVLAIGDQLPKESEQERAAAEALATFRQDGFGYFLEMATRPQTIGYALLDSPVALAAWLLDHDTDSYYKISRAFVDGEPVGNLTRDTIVDNITLYWLTGTAASAARSYWEDGRALAAALASGQPPPAVTVPVGFTTFPGEIWARPAQLGRGGLPRPRLLQRGRQPREDLRMRGGAEVQMRRLQVASLIASSMARRSIHWTAPVQWLNSEPLTGAGLGGKVVLVQFWTYTCINWIRTLPYVRAWSERYRDHGAGRRRRAHARVPVRARPGQRPRGGEDMHVDYPIVIDNGYAIWGAFSNRYWPALYFVDAEGAIRHHHFGEGEYESSERVLQELLTEAGARRRPSDVAPVVGDGVEAAADWGAIRSPETYLGMGAPRDRASEDLRLNDWALSGDWSVAHQAAMLTGAEGRIAYRFQPATCTSSWAQPSEERPSHFECLSTVRRRTAIMESTSTKTARGRSRRSGCISSFASAAPSARVRSRSSSSRRASRRTLSRSGRGSGRIRSSRCRGNGGRGRGPRRPAAQRGHQSATRQTNVGAGASDGLTTVGPYEVVVPAEDLDAARELIRGDARP